MKLWPSLKILRPHQWLKNLMLFFPPFLGGLAFHKNLILIGLVPFLAFCSASSAAYIFNDLMDVDSDRQHPAKALRPLAAGRISRSSAVVMMIVLLIVAGLLGGQVSLLFLLYLGLYLVLSVFYSITLKNLPIVDVFCIATGFVLRLYAGGEAFGIEISDWLFLTVFLLALFLSFGKRVGEQSLLGESAGEHRHALLKYPKGFLESAMYLSGGTVLVTYSVYAIGRPLLVYSVPLCMFGLLRYLLRVKAGKGGDPTESLLRDFPLLVIGVLWILLVGWSIYR